MKKIFCFLISAIMMISFASCKSSEKASGKVDTSKAQEIDASMPEPFDKQLGESGGDERAQYYQPCNEYLDGITKRLSDLVDENEFDKWFDSFGVFPTAPTSLMDYANVFSFIVHFNISDEDFIKIIKLENKISEENGWTNTIYTDEDIEILLSRDESKVMEHFASKYSIVNNGKIYSPQWIYTHTIQAYEAEEIPPELIEEKMELYKDIPFSPKALDALEKKLNSYIKMDLSFDKATKETVSETSASETSTETSTETTSETNLETSVSE